MKPFDTAEVNSVGGRAGQVQSAHGARNLDLTLPRRWGPRQTIQPEMLFAAGYAACIVGAHGARRSPSRNSILTRSSSSAKEASAPTKAAKPVAEGRVVCPYSGATRGNIPVNLTWRPRRQKLGQETLDALAHSRNMHWQRESASLFDDWYELVKLRARVRAGQGNPDWVE